MSMSEPYRHLGVLAKLREQRAIDFSSAELDRVFHNCVSPVSCKRIVAWMLAAGLVIEETRHGK